MDRIKVISGKVARGAFLAVGVPYGIAIITNIALGWPCSQQGEDKYKRALNPSRVLKVSYAVAEQFTLVRFLPLNIKWSLLYRAGNKVMKDVEFGVNGNTLDVWTPYSTSNTYPEPTRPVMVFVYGGAWGSGDKAMYGLLAQEIMDNLGALVVIPNYSIYPKGDVKEMIRDVHDTIAYIKSPSFHETFHDVDQNKIILFGHSAGAHLCAQSVIELAEGLLERSASDRPADGIKVEERDGMTEVDTAKLLDSSAFSPSELLSSIRGVVGVGGVYQIMDHYHHESWRGVEDLSPMWRAMNGLENFDHFSPTERVLKMSQEQIERLPPIYLIHGTDDKVVPLSSTEKFSTTLTERDADVTVRLIGEGGHAELIMDMMERGRKFYDVMMNLITLEFADKVFK
ncbi:probable isoprenylcysteine alpha-carbonyl methylesterase ICMEL2 [Lytechinus variegatus]|uniref:probable isoprenylcysteine alpha-carbonyl methylesterase ICMEL2 n=1 Tax=Lytechinus variegatus TaxID=7654 RepID=UPI001BB2ABA2|nr:probable isoprenylcysteine alpha-carbonyl methylesterase ICMEL2 [Lytechinus variegatus]XP_041485045.1 probable isoprenylcysteine alpha-carbonyl methylesterase ICMEL2 [Lytechinus variegatus]XP_041485046.1 probable isoprenylcysteine alpha-carbonyl methylesterase ICMEL2 [Lytechinus variegatus]